MISKLIKIIFVFSLLLYLFHSLFFWMFESTDSYFYFAFAQFIRTGTYFIPSPYQYTVPSTMEPPLYSVILFLTQFFPKSDVLIHFLQIAAIVISAYFLYRIFMGLMPKTPALFFATLFLLVPAHFVYVSNLVAEPIAIFFISFYLFLLYRYIEKKEQNLLGFLLFLSAVMSLQRYNLLGFFGVSLLLFFRLKRKKIFAWYGLFSGVAIFAGWILINHFLNGSWGFSNSEGKHLYNRILHFDRLLPPVDDPHFIRFRQIVGEARLDWARQGIDYFKPWWFYEPALIRTLGSETASSQLMQEVSLAALKTNPMQYILNTPRFFFFAHDVNPTFSDVLYRYSGTMEKNCRNLGTISFCDPMVKTPYNFHTWDALVRGIDWYYLHISRYVNFFLLFPSLVFALFQKKKFLRLCGVLYLGSVLLFILVEAPLPRYLYIFTPLQVILIGYFFTKKRIS